MDKPVYTKTRCKQKRTPLQQDETIRRSHMKGQRFRKKISDKMTRDQYALSSNETVNIIPLGDFHIGSSEFNYE